MSRVIVVVQNKNKNHNNTYSHPKLKRNFYNVRLLVCAYFLLHLEPVHDQNSMMQVNFQRTRVFINTFDINLQCLKMTPIFTWVKITRFTGDNKHIATVIFDLF